MSPNPVAYSTSYGSPAITPTSRTFTGGTARGALGNVLQSVQAANQQDRQARERAQMGRASSVARNDDFDDDGGDGDDGHDDAASMPPPPRPNQSK